MATLSPDRKVITIGEEAHKKISKGINFAADVVCATLGPAGRNTLIERKHRSPQITNDGLTTANTICLDDELENLGVSAVIDAAKHTSDIAGDGTTTTTALVRAIYNAGRKLIGDTPNAVSVLIAGNKSPMQIRAQIHEEKEKALALLKKLAKKVKTPEELEAVAFAAVENREYAKIIADTVSKVGEYGHVIVEENWGSKIETDIFEGMRFAARLADERFYNTPERDGSYENVPIFLTDEKLNDLAPLMPLFQQIAGQGKYPSLLIVATKFEQWARDAAVAVNVGNARNGNAFRLWLVAAPSWSQEEFEDAGIFLGAKYFSKGKGDKVETATLADLGHADKFVVTRAGEGTVLGGAGSKENIKGRVEWIKKELESEVVEMMKARLKFRIGALASAVGIIKVASPTDGETEYIRMKFKNGVKSTQAAMEEGIVRGGGLALKEIAEKMPEGSILREALQDPYNQIQKNAGGTLKIPYDVFDAAKVERVAIEEACSTAGMLVTMNMCVGFKNELPLKEQAEILATAILSKKKTENTNE